MVTEVFAVGSVLYEIATGKGLFVELEDHKIEQKHAAGEFPPLDGVVDGVSGLGGLGRVIGKCWEG